MKNAAKFQNKTPEKIARQYWRGVRVKQGFIILVLLLYFAGSVWGIWWKNSQFLGVLLQMLVLVIATFPVSVWISWDFMSLNAILNLNCDPVTYVQVMRLLGKKHNSKRFMRMIQMNEAAGLMWSGRFSEALTLAESLAASEKNLSNQINLLYIRFNCSLKLENQVAALQIQQEMKDLASTITRPVLQKRGKEALEMMAGAIALHQGDYEAFRRIEEARSAGYRANLQYVSSAINLAKVDIAQGETENARTRLEYAAQMGGTLYVAEDARLLLAEL